MIIHFACCDVWLEARRTGCIFLSHGSLHAYTHIPLQCGFGKKCYLVQYGIAQESDGGVHIGRLREKRPEEESERHCG